jgi:hypothetical protein
VKPEELARIEQSLGISLPASYKAAVAPFPVPAAAGNSDLAVWDDAERLVAFNLDLRRGAPGGVKPWPPHFFAVGHPGDGSPYALDLSSGDAVWWVDHCHLDNPATAREAEAFGPWMAAYCQELREEMAGEEVDPDGTPDHRRAGESRGARQSLFGCLILAAVVVALVAGLRWLMR